MAAKNQAAFGVYRDSKHLEQGIYALLDSGLRSEDISILLPQKIAAGELGIEKHVLSPDEVVGSTPEGVAIGRTLGLLAGVSALAIPGCGALLAAGPLANALVDAGSAGAAGGVAGALVALGLPEHDARHYEDMIQAGSALLSVQCNGSEWIKRAKDSLQLTGATNISSTRRGAPSGMVRHGGSLGS